MKMHKVIALALLLGVGVYLGLPATFEAVTPSAGDTPLAASSTNVAPETQQAVVQDGSSPTQPGTATTQPKTFQAFDAWMEKAAVSPVTPAELEEGLQLAQARKTAMQSLMRTNPTQALAQAVSLKEYAALPETIKPYVEKPFSERVDIMILPDESGLNPQKNKPRFDPNRRTVGEQITLTFKNHESLTLVPHGSRAGILSKDGLATQGIALDDVAIIHPAALQVVQAEDADYIQKTFPARTTNTQNDFFTGETIQGEPVMALAGGQVFYFASAVNVERLNLQLAELEKQRHPKVGSQVLFAGQKQPGFDGTTTNNTPLATQINQLLAGPAFSWSATDKKVYFIRVTFSDKPLRDAVTQSKLASDLQKVSDNIWEMSHGKSRMSVTVNENAVLMAQPSTYYYDKPNNVQKDSLAHSDAIAALRAVDSSFNPDDYDMIGVFFPNLWDGAPGWASLGGGDLWIFDYDNEYLLTHEFGHTYGLDHAHFWQTTDGSSVGAGTTDEYGDSFDFMGGTYDNRDDYHMQGQVLLGWLLANDWQDVTTSGQYRLKRFDHENASGVRGLRVGRGTSGGHYWLGHRQKFDDNKYLENGLYLIWQKSGRERSWLVDTTPGSADSATSADRKDGAILLGRTYSDTLASPDVHITPVAKGGAEPDQWIDVQVNIGDFAGNTAPVISGISGGTGVKARTAANFIASASDADGDSLAYYWDFGDGVINPSVASISHQWAVGGTYTVKLTVSDMKGGTASTQMIVTVEDPLNVWTQRTSNANKDLHDIATDGNKVVAVSGSQMKYVVYSTDGIIWSKSPEFDLGVHMRGIAYANGLWVAVGQDWLGATRNWPGAIFTSTDGVTWTRRYQANIGVTALYKVAYGNGTWVAVGESGMIVTSSDGINWTAQTSGTTKTLNDIAFGNGQFVAIGKGTGAMMVLTSADGVTWTDRSSGTNLTDSWRYFSYTDYLYDRFIASGWFTGVAYSTDNGVTFRNNQSTRQSVPASAYGRSVFFAAGVDNPSQSDERDINLVSTDGMSWTELTTTSQPNRNAAVFFKNTFITVGNSGSIYQSALLSTDTTPATFTFSSKTDVALSSAVISDPVQITDIDAVTSWNVTDGEACVSSANDCNCGVAGFAASGTVTNNQYMCVRHTASNNYASSVSSTLTVGGISGSFGSTTLKNSQTITFGALSDKTLGTADFNISATASSNLTVSFSSQTPTVCTVAGTSVHLVAAGTCTIRASQAGNSTYNAAADVDRSFTVSPVAVNGSCGNDNDATLTSQPTNLCTVGTASNVTTGNSSYNWSCTGLYSGSTANCSATRHYSVTSSMNGGNGTISASQTVAYQATPSFTLTPNSGYVADSVTGTCGGTLSGNTFTTNTVTAGCTVVASFVAKSNQTITFADLSNKILGDADFNISATASSNLTVSFSSQTLGVCTVAGTSVHLVDAGTCTIRASQAGNSTYNAAADVDRSFTVSPAAVNGSCGNDNGATLTSQPTNLCTVGTASNVTTGNSSYNWSCTGLYSGSTANCSATRHYSVTSSVNGGNGTISASQTVAYQATPSFTLTPNSGYVADSVTGTCGGTLSGNTFTTNAVTAGCTVVASFVAKSNQTITFADLSNKILGDADFNISATASSNLTVSFSSQTPTVCTVAGTSVHLVAAGTCTIRASQAGNSTYNAAADVDRSFTVSPAAVNGSCGNDNDATLTSQPTNLCTVGTASSVTTGNSSYNWSCTGLYSGSTANCSATRHYSVTSSVNGGNGTISASQTVAYQATPSFTLTPNSGYVADSVTGTCGGTLSDNTFTTNTVTAGCSVIASFINDASGGGTDSDNDGVKDADDQAPNNPNVATPDDQQGNPVTLETNHAFQNIEIVSASTLPSTGKPDESNYQFPKGAIEYTVVGVPNGGTITVTITFASTIPTGSKVYKISSTGGYQLFPNAVINGNQVTLTLTDGGLGDDDDVVNGQIKDPVAIAEPVNNTTTTTAGSGGGGGSVSLAWLLFALMIYVLRYRNQRGMYW